MISMIMENNTYHEITDEVQERIDTLLTEFTNSSLGTNSPSGYPMITKTIPLIRNNEIYLLLSDLSEHTRNLKEDNRCALQFVAEEKHKTRMNNARLTYQGKCDIINTNKESEDFQNLLAAYCSSIDKGAKMWGMFNDFNFYRFTIERTLYIEGFAKAFMRQ